MLKRLLLIVLSAGIALPLPAAQDESFGDQVRRLLHEGFDNYKRGKLDEAYSKFEEAFQMKPSDDQVYAAMKRAGEDLVAGMMNSGDRRMQDVGHRLFELAKPGEPLREGKETVLKYIEELKSDVHEIQRNAHWHLKNFGPYSVRFEIPALGNQNEDKYRSRIMALLTEKGVDGSLALIEALDSKDPFIRQNAAIVLGNVKDDRAIPALKRVVEDANEPPEVKKFADEALRKIIRAKDDKGWRKATEYYYELAMKYYYSHSAAILAWQRDFLVWKWDVENDRLTERKAARMVFNEHLAEEALYDLLELDPEFVDGGSGMSAWSLFACVHFAQGIEARTGVEAAVNSIKAGDPMVDRAGLIELIRQVEGMSPASVEEIAGRINGAASMEELEQVTRSYTAKLAKAIRAFVLGQIPGKKYVYEALSRSLADGNYLVAKECIETIGEMGLQDDLPAPPPPADAPEIGDLSRKERKALEKKRIEQAFGHPLIEALTNEDKRVRYAAAETMVKLNPQRRKLGMELVIPNLIDALGEQGVRVALVIYDVSSEADHDFMNLFRKTLYGINVFPVIVHSGSEGVVKAKQFPSEDVIIIQKKIAGQVYFQESAVKKPIVESVFDTLRDDVRTRNVPRILLCDTPEEENAANKEFLEKGTAAGVITRDVHKLDLRAMLEKIFDLPEAKKDAKDRADIIAQRAAQTLASIDPTNTLYPYRDSVDALIQTVNPDPLREDFIRIPSANALGRYGDQRGLDVLAKVVADKASDPGQVAVQEGVREACSKAISQIFRAVRVAPSEEVYQVLKAFTKDGDFDIEFNCAEALGNADLTNVLRLDASKHRRIERETYTAEDP